MRPVVTSLVALALMGALLAAPTAAQDPDPDSPSGHIYEIPLDDGRGDAAPRRLADDRGSETGSSIRSENGFGSSTTVPGSEDVGTGPPEDSAGQPGGGRDAARSGSGAADDRDPSAEEVGTQADGLSADRERAVAERAAQQTAAAPPSLSRALLLISLGVVVAAGLGAASRRR